jgi:hypothetical protein
MASVAEDMTQILMTLRALEDRMKALKAMLNPVKKPRKANPWILFNQRINALMKENNTAFLRIGDAKKFASSLKKQKGYTEWTDPEIISERTDWLMDTLKACVVCEENPKDDVTQHRDCVVKFATEEKIHKNPVGAWLCASSAIRSTTTHITTVDEAHPKRRRCSQVKPPMEAEPSDTPACMTALPGST